jgi:hypothetical protein
VDYGNYCKSGRYAGKKKNDIVGVGAESGNHPGESFYFKNRKGEGHSLFYTM